MKQVLIRRCPTCPNIGSLTDSLLAALGNEEDVQVHVEDGAKGEFTVEVDGRKVATPKGEMLPTVAEVVSAVQSNVGAVI
jgi:hypothetical protein